MLKKWFRKFFKKPLRQKPSEFRTKKFKYKGYTVYVSYCTYEHKTLDYGPVGGINITFEGHHPKKGMYVLSTAINRSALADPSRYTSVLWHLIKISIRRMDREKESE